MEKIRQFLVTFIIFLVIDLLWLGIIAKRFYDEQLGPLLTDNVIWPSALLFYILFVVGLLYFAIEPGLKAKSLKLTIKNGSLYGFFTYMTYELTNYAVITDWPFGLVTVDIIWGVVLATSVSYFSFKILRR
jgi:uncharacterized membrane protein